MYFRRAQRHVDRRCKELEYEPAAVSYALGVGLDFHVRLNLARAGGNENSRTLNLDDAYTTNIDGGQGLELGESSRPDGELAARFENGRSLWHLHLAAVDAEVHQALGQTYKHRSRHLSRRPQRRNRRADGAGCGLAQSADRGVTHGLRDIAQQPYLTFARGAVTRRDQPVKSLLLANGSNAAGHALAAGLVAG